MIIPNELGFPHAPMPLGLNIFMIALAIIVLVTGHMVRRRRP